MAGRLGSAKQASPIESGSKLPHSMVRSRQTFIFMHTGAPQAHGLLLRNAQYCATALRILLQQESRSRAAPGRIRLVSSFCGIYQLLKGFCDDGERGTLTMACIISRFSIGSTILLIGRACGNSCRTGST
jgi:hypothetical protein